MSLNIHAGHASKDEWLTPPEIIHSLGTFDLDPCSPINRPWDTAKTHFTIDDNGLLRDWFGRVWLNPPYGRMMPPWLDKLALHGNGIAFVFGRTDINAFHNHVFPFADSIFFVKGRISFHHVSGQRADSNSGAASVLIAYGQQNSEALDGVALPGRHVPLNSIKITVIGIDQPWRVIIKTVLIRLNEPAHLEKIYGEVERMASDKIRRNRHYKAKIRQVLQQHFTRITKGTYGR